MKTALSLGLSVMLAASGAPRLVAEAAAAVSAAEASDALWRATAFLQSISAGGGYLWHYSVDLQRRAGESMADANLIWIQPPGTPTVGQAYLRAYAATKQSRYLDAARSVAAALGRCQLEFSQSATVSWNSGAKLTAPNRCDPRQNGTAARSWLRRRARPSMRSMRRAAGSPRAS
jgi:hypothetical protein